MKIIELFEESPIIASVRDEAGLRRSLESDCRVVFVLFGDMCGIARIAERLKEHDKVVIIHVDLIGGLSPRDVAIDFIKSNTSADGIISTKPILVRRALELGLYGGQRSFLIDSLALNTLKCQLEAFVPDFIEIVPGIMPKVLRSMRSYTTVPLVAGGLLADRKDIIAAFDAGMDAISTTKGELWGL